MRYDTSKNRISPISKSRYFEIRTLPFDTVCNTWYLVMHKTLSSTVVVNVPGTKTQHN